MKEKIGIGIIGTGFARKVQIPAFKSVARAEIVSIASKHLANARETASEFGVGHYTDVWRETIDRDDVDLVCITTPPATHREVALHAISNGKHILCEKPMALNAAEAREMTARAGEYGMLALIDHELRFQDGRQKALQMLRDGVIGKIHHVRYVFRNPQRTDESLPWNWWADKSQAGGALGAVGSHAIDSFLWLTGAKITDVFCQLRTHIKQRKDSGGQLRQVTSDDEAGLLLRFADNELLEDATASISISMVEFPDYRHFIEFSGTTGAMRIGYRGDLAVTKGADGWREIDTAFGEGVEGIFDSGFPSGFMAFAPKIVEAILLGRNEVENAATFADGLAVQEVIDAAQESNQTGTSIKI